MSRSSLRRGLILSVLLVPLGAGTGFSAAAPARGGGVVLTASGWFAAARPRPSLKSLEARPAPPVPVAAANMSNPQTLALLRPRIEVVNQSSAAVEGILIRYDFALKIASVRDLKRAAWAVPFMMDEWRIPRLLPGKTQSILLDPEFLRATTARLSAEGFTAEGLRFEAMLEPRPGDARPLQEISGEIKILP